ncbi:MAG: ABC transporter ATP-binding protein [Lachnospiraceae bacterium]|nr:ABC transporter ATP-binding protein [Lachnospiraceae bacterium]
MLKIKNLHVNCGNLNIIQGVSMDMKEGEIVSLMGANGAGKTTLMRAVSGLGRIVSGSVEFLGQDITTAGSEKIVEAGLIQVPEGRKLFPLMSVKENLEVGAYTKRAMEKSAENLEYVYSMFPELQKMSTVPVGNLSGGQQQMVAIGRGIMAEPKLLILDEPSIGLSPLMTQRVLEAVKQINKKGVAVLIAEQNIYDVLKLAQRAYVLQQGQVATSGTAQEILENEEIKSMYLGM